MNSVELFAGAGGLATGVTLAGFKSMAVVERDKWACDTIEENQRRGYPLVQDWRLWRGDVREFDWNGLTGEIDLVAGGPPCQPFSMGGKHRAHVDSRDMFPATVDIVRRLRPKAVLIENVKGLTRASFSHYFDYILHQLRFPENTIRARETWMEHLRRLKAMAASKSNTGALSYSLRPTLVNAANYGVPQKRERVFIVGFRTDLHNNWTFPEATHSLDALLYQQWVTGEYWERHAISKRRRPPMPESLRARVARLRDSLWPRETQPWRTVRDALSDMPEPGADGHAKFANHRLQAGARPYKGHTGSRLDEPAKTLKAGDHGVPGGENMMAKDDGSYRYFSVRESARLQTFPDGYVFHGSWTETMRQLGNAVPVSLGRIVAASVHVELANAALAAEKTSLERSVA